MIPMIATIVEALGGSVLIGSSLWVLGVQPLSLSKDMPRAKFLPLQMRLIKAWSRTLVPLTGAVLVGAIGRIGAGPQLLPALIGLAGAALTAWWALPHAFRQGGQAIRVNGEEEIDAGAFLSEGGGDATRIWHRVVLGTVAGMLGGVLWDGVGLLG